MPTSRWDTLLDYVSAKRRGSWTDFRSSVLWISDHDPHSDPSQRQWLPQILRTRMSSLGHVDYGDDHSWAVAPPVLAILKRETLTDSAEFEGVLCGVRDQKLVEDIVNISASNRLPIYFTSNDLAPTSITVHASDKGDLVKLAGMLNITSSYRPGELMIRCLPYLDAWMLQRKERTNFSPSDQFDPAKNSWVSSHSILAGNAYRLAEFPQKYFVYFGGSWRIVTRAEAEFYAFREAGINPLQYRDGSVHLHQRIALPDLLERALVLHSGRPPELRADGLKRIYQSIPSESYDHMLGCLGLGAAKGLAE